MKILICDDHAVIRDGLELLLKLEKDLMGCDVNSRDKRLARSWY